MKRNIFASIIILAVLLGVSAPALAAGIPREVSETAAIWLSGEKKVTADIVKFSQQYDLALPPALLWAGGAAVLLTAVILTVWLVRKYTKGRGGFRRGLPLEQYAAAYGDRLSARSIVSLAMPLALDVRDRHMRGELCPELSPNTVMVTKKGCVFRRTRPDDGFVPQRFVAAECLGRAPAGIDSDIASFCAVLDYFVSAIPEPGAEEAAVRAVIQKGRLDRADRYATMQELIYALAPLNTGISPEFFKKAAPPPA